MLYRLEGQLSRRDLLKQVGLAGAAIVAMPELRRVLLFRRGLLAQPPATTLTATEFATLDAICARLVPTDENGPGAKEAHAANYIDRALGGALASYRDDYSLGLAALNVYVHVNQTSERTFADLTAEEQDAVLKEMEQDVPLGFIPSSARFFTLIRAHTLQGMFSDPAYGGNANFVGWDLVGYPGVRLTVAASEQDMSTPAKANHKSAYDYVMFSTMGADVHGH
jgi:gluconate 2-dehydrogenase gamma chain